MVDETIKYEDDHETIKVLLKELMKRNPVSKWENKNTITFKEGKKELGTITFTDKKYEVTVNIDNQVKELKKLMDEIKNNPIKADDLKNTPFQGLLEIKNKFGGVFENKTLLSVYIKKLKVFGIDNIKMGGSVNQSESISNKLIMAFEIIPYGDISEPLESGYQGRLRTFLKNTYETDAKNATDIVLRDETVKYFTPLEKESIINLEIDKQLIGKYYPERNFIQIFFNPFTLKKVGIFDDTPHMAFNNILAVLKEADVKKLNVDNLKEKLFISEFMKNSRNRLKEYRNTLNNYESKLRETIEEMSSKMSEADYIKASIESSGKGLFTEIEESKKLPFLTGVEIDAGSIVYKFKPCLIPIPNFKRRDFDEGFGKRYVWIGATEFRINSTEFKINTDVDFVGHGHPHASGHNGNPCFGSGEGRNKIYESLASNRFTELAKLLWFWIKTYRNEGAYVKVWDAYDNTLQHGYPLFNEKGNRIEINDPILIKSGEQVTLAKKDDYEENHKKFMYMKFEL